MVTLLSPQQRHSAGAFDPDADSWPILLDALHSLMLIYDEDGLPAAREWLARTGKGKDPRFSELIAAALAAIPRVRERGEFARPEARILDSLRTALFEGVPRPADPEPPAEQLGLGLEPGILAEGGSAEA